MALRDHIVIIKRARIYYCYSTGTTWSANAKKHVMYHARVTTICELKHLRRLLNARDTSDIICSLHANGHSVQGERFPVVVATLLAKARHAVEVQLLFRLLLSKNVRGNAYGPALKCA